MELCRKIGAAKQKEHVRALEEAILKEIQEKHSKSQAEEEGLCMGLSGAMGETGNLVHSKLDVRTSVGGEVE